MDREQIKRLALANGFKLKTQADGSEDLNEYVYVFAIALLDCRPVVKDKLPLKPLVWTDYYDPESKTWSAIAPTHWGQHVIRQSFENPNKYTVSYGKGRTREVATIEDGKDWAENTYHPSAMRDWVYSLDEIKKELVK